ATAAAAAATTRPAASSILGGTGGTNSGGANGAGATPQRLAALEGSLREESARRAEAERRKDDVERQLDEAEAWMERYEAGHGMEEAARHAKQLARDIRRLEAELTTRGQQLGEALDAKEVLLLMCDRLKRDAGKPSDFAYADIPTLRAEHQSEVERLRAVQAEMAEQMSDMEEERLHMLQRLRDNAAAVSDKGLRLVGLDAAQLEKVSEFARHLRDGTAMAGATAGSVSGSPPPDKRAPELRRELREAKEECRRKDRLIERLDQELAAAERAIAAATAAGAVSALTAATTANSAGGGNAHAGGGGGAAHALGTVTPASAVRPQSSGGGGGGGSTADGSLATDVSVVPELARIREELGSLRDIFRLHTSKTPPPRSKKALPDDGTGRSGCDGVDTSPSPVAGDDGGASGDASSDETPLRRGRGSSRRGERGRMDGGDSSIPVSGGSGGVVKGAAVAAVGSGAEGAGALHRRRR
ncbi:unnamed protein product, partial [Phaeothamnion confervicola]